jgi:hypothetical protein
MKHEDRGSWDWEQIPPTETLQLKALRLIAEQRPHCKEHRRFEYDCVDCLDAAKKENDAA